jgi:hypothetical protein
MMIRRFHPLCSGQFAGERFGVVDQHGKVLGADPEFLISVVEYDERYFLRRAVAGETMRFVRHGEVRGSRFEVQSLKSKDTMRNNGKTSKGTERRFGLRVRVTSFECEVQASGSIIQ